MCTVVGEERDVDLGASIVLRCRSAFYDSVIWYYGELDSDKNYILYWDSIFTKDSGRFKVLRPNSLRGIFDLSISNVQLSDAGIYRCHEYAVQHPGEVVYRLTVTGQWMACMIKGLFISPRLNETEMHWTISEQVFQSCSVSRSLSPVAHNNLNASNTRSSCH